MPEETPKQETKQWETVATFNNYEEAKLEKEKLLKTNEQVKVKAIAAGKLFRVKVWNPPVEKKAPAKKKTKKGKNANKKVRSGQTPE